MSTCRSAWSTCSASSSASRAPGTIRPEPGRPPPSRCCRAGRHVRGRRPHLLAPGLLYGLLVRLLSPEPARRRRQHGARWASCGSCAACWSSGPGGGGSSWAAATAFATGSSAGCTWPSNNATRSWPSGHRDRSRPTAWSSRPSWNGRATWSPPPSNPTSSGHLRPPSQPRGRLGLRPPRPRRRPRRPLDPLAHCRTYSDARRIGRMLADAADIQGHKAEDANYWLLGAKLLSVLLFAAAGTGRSMADVPAGWTSRTSTTSPKP